MSGHSGRGETREIPVDSLAPGDSPRLSGEDAEHARLLAESDNPLPPILVHRATMRVVDGAHRLRAAMLRGEETIAVEFFDGDERDAFVAAVRANVGHGLPLTLADREAAAARIVTSHPHHSDRAIAAISGLAAKTVAAIRRRTGAGKEQVTARIGRDGRVRPLSSAEARRVASETIARHPQASLRAVARLAGLSPATVRDVRDRLARGDDPVPTGQREEGGGRIPGRRRTGPQRHRTGTENRVGRPGGGTGRDRATLLRNLNRDPSLRFSESGRNLLRWMFSRASGPEGWEQVVERMPSHCAYVVAEVARGCAEEWLAFADRLERRMRNTG
ncbi:ParB/RepB/Spo0J family partition protein [Micromonospora sp. NPDC092111]|uniref:ParB/RepB/Spo0J family partition protein n=1 Tax=Micromonospora sp. NPDC092111 TaxID=3364289 RepID=UPI0038082243